MFRKINSYTKAKPHPFKVFDKISEDLSFSLEPSINRTQLNVQISKERIVSQGDLLAQNDSLSMHASQSGKVSLINEHEIKISVDSNKEPGKDHEPTLPSKQELPQTAASIGLVGMGGSMFPYSIKFKASQNINTLVINAVECEPGIEIDLALMIYSKDFILKAVNSLKEILDIEKVVIAVKKSSFKFLQPSIDDSWEILQMDDKYPSGAEKLIVSKLSKKTLSFGMLPFHLGYLVMSVSSLWSLGRYFSCGLPVVDRPLTISVYGKDAINTIVPIGVSIKDLLKYFNIEFNPKEQIIIAGGLMMGRQVFEDFRVLKGTNAIFIIPLNKRLLSNEQNCILCGSCFDICPLKLHPVSMAQRIKEEKYSTSLEEQLNECFLCGACSSVCPSEIQLVHYFQGGKKWLRTR